MVFRFPTLKCHQTKFSGRDSDAQAPLPSWTLKTESLDGESVMESELDEDLVGIGDLLNLVQSLVEDQGTSQQIVCVNGEWGVGKSFFLTHLRKQLQDNGFKVAFVNAWENDLLRDPLPCLIEEISEVFPKAPPVTLHGLKEAGLAVARTALPHALRALAPGVGEALAATMGDTMQQKLEEQTSAKKCLDTFRTSLSAFAADVKEKTKQRLVVIVDELDRCRPDFSLRLLETLKHMFAEPDIAFVVGVHREQLAESTRAVYGPKFDGERYLDRFFNLELKLPRSYQSFIESEWDRRSVYSDPQVRKLAIEQLVEICERTNPPYRSVEHVLNRLKVSLMLYPEELCGVFPIPQIFTALNFFAVVYREYFDRFVLGNYSSELVEIVFPSKPNISRQSESLEQNRLRYFLDLYQRKFNYPDLLNSVKQTQDPRTHYQSPHLEFFSSFSLDFWPGRIEPSFTQFEKAILLAGNLSSSD